MAYREELKTQLVNEICERVSKGEALRTILKEENMPDSKTFYNWIDSDEEKLQQYARAKEEYAESMFEDILKIADATDNDVLIVDGEPQTNHNVINRDRLRVDTRKWALSKLMPKKYGDKLDLTSGGEKIQTPVFTSNPLDE